MALLAPELLVQSLPSIERSAPRKRQGSNLRMLYADPNSTPSSALQAVEQRYKTGTLLSKSVRNLLDGPDDSLERLAFERDPQRISEYAGIYRPKLQGVPDVLLKRIALQDDLVSAVVHTRSNHVAQMGRKQQDRHQKGLKFQVEDGYQEKLDENGRKALQDRIDRLEKLLSTCGHTNGWSEQDKCSFPEFLYMQARNGCVVGRMATEVIWVPDPTNPGKRRFHSFRPTDAGTIYFAAPYHEANQQVRESALHLIENLKNEKLQKEKFENEEYAWVQVIEGRPVQAFGTQEMLVHSFAPVTDVEQQGYPIAPLETALSAVTTHINITHHNRLYFQSGRAARGMLIIKSEDIDPDTMANVKQQFNASINSVQNAWRMPVFGIGPNDELNWQAIDQAGGRDMEFQYLADQNARTILAAFQMSPEEVPGYQHLSKGTNNQSLSESSEEWKLTAARDVGIRPFIAQFEDFLNASIVPLIDADLAKIGKLRLLGLDLDTEEKESVRLQQDMPVHMTYNEVLTKVEKKALSVSPLGTTVGDLPLNPTVFQYIQMFLTFGEILETYCGVAGASKHPDKQFYMNPFWQQEHQNQMQMQMQQQQAAQQAAQPAQPGQPGQPPPGGGQPPPAPPQGGQDQGGGDLSGGIDQLLSLVAKSEGLLSKGEANAPEKLKRLRARNKLANAAIMEAFRVDMDKAVDDIARIADQHSPKYVKPKK